MDSNVWKQGLIDKVEKELQANPTIGPILWEYRSEIIRGRFPEWLVDSTFQKFERFNNIDIYDVWAFLQLVGGICTNKIGTKGIFIDETPHSDNSLRNNKILQMVFSSNELSVYGFKGEFLGGPGDNDGYIEWGQQASTYPIPFKLRNSLVDIPSPKGHFPLEVGYTESATTLGHLISERCLARWPYHSKSIILFKVISEDWFPPLKWFYKSRNKKSETSNGLL